MRLFQGFEHLSDIPNPVLTIGTFDGVHLGHQKIIQLNSRKPRKFFCKWVNDHIL